MKKLIIAAAIVCAAVYAQAAAYTWKAIQGGVYAAGSTTDTINGTAYLFNAGTVTEQALLTALISGSDIESLSYVATGTMSAGKVTETPEFTYNGVAGGSSWNAYLAIVSGDEVFISNQKTGILAPTGVDAQPIAIGTTKTASQAALKDFTETYSGAGWYSTTAVPEPTSGLLLLLGMAGLALKRKIA